MFVRALLVALIATLGCSGVANAAQLIDRGATGVKLVTNTKGEALLTYRKAGKTKRVLVWGAINAAFPARGMAQVKFKVDFALSRGKYHKQYWRTFGGICGKYDGPALPNLVAACKACNNRKADRTPEAAGMKLHYVPYVPNRYEAFILSNRKILADQMEFLLQGVPKSSRMHMSI